MKKSIENEYEGKVVLVTGGAKLFFYKETFTKERNKGKRRYAIKNGSW